jgi:hypothetical protein
MNNIHRREFLKGVSLAAASVAALPTIIPSSALGAAGTPPPSDRIVMGCIGVGGQGTHNMRAFLGRRDVQVISVCDVDANHRQRAMKHVNGRYKNKDCAEFNDFRDLLANDTVDAVTVCTPDHWHGLASIAAAKAGKDIYCEKPLTNTVAEGKAVYDAVSRYGRVLQTGSHERSRPNARLACELVRNGRIGKLHTIEISLPCDQGHHMAVRNDKSVHREMPIPDGFDYNMWLGHCPDAPYTQKRCHFSWRFVLDHGGGEMTDRGAHVIDLGQLGNGTDATTPISYQATGTLPETTSNLWNTYFNYKFECMYANGVRMVGNSNSPRGVKFIGDDGWIFIHVHGGNLRASNTNILREKIGADEIQIGRSPGHHADFINCVKSRGVPMASAQVGYHSAVICHLLNISIQLGGRKLKWDPQNSRILDDDQANRMLARPMRSPWSL